MVGYLLVNKRFSLSLPCHPLPLPVLCIIFEEKRTEVSSSFSWECSRLDIKLNFRCLHLILANYLKNLPHDQMLEKYENHEVPQYRLHSMWIFKFFHLFIRETHSTSPPPTKAKSKWKFSFATGWKAMLFGSKELKLTVQKQVS